MSNFGYGYQPQGANPHQQQPPMGWNVPPAAQGGQQPYNAHFAEQGNAAGMPKNELGFNDSTIRAQFVRKVFSIVGIMLAVVASMSAIPFLHPPMQTFVQRNSELYFLGYITFFIVYFALICCEGVRRSYPTNIVLLAILTLSIGFMTMMITAQYKAYSVLMAFAITSLSCFGIAMFATITKKDLTSMMGILLIATMCLALFGLFTVIVAMFTSVHIMLVVYASLGAFLFMVWLAVDIQMVMGGRTYELSPEEHIFASITLFLDIIQIFWFLLALIGERD